MAGSPPYDAFEALLALEEFIDVNGEAFEGYRSLIDAYGAITPMVLMTGELLVTLCTGQASSKLSCVNPGPGFTNRVLCQFSQSLREGKIEAYIHSRPGEWKSVNAHDWPDLGENSTALTEVDWNRSEVTIAGIQYQIRFSKGRMLRAKDHLSKSECIEALDQLLADGTTDLEDSLKVMAHKIRVHKQLPSAHLPTIERYINHEVGARRASKKPAKTSRRVK